MNFKEYLLNQKSKLEKRKADLKARACKTDDAEELRSLTSDLEDIIDELNDIKEQIRKIEDEEQAPKDESTDTTDKEEENARSVALNKREVPDNATLVNGRSVASFKTLENKRADKDIYSSYEYRMAFKEYAQRGTQIPYELRDNSANTNTLGATIPTTVLNEFINEIKLKYGNLYNKVRKLNIQGNLRVPIAKLQATFKWVSEATVSPKQNGGDYSDFVEFSANTAELRVSQTLLSSIVTLDLFEREIVNVMLIAFLQAMDNGIVNGTGNGQMLGILNDPRVQATGNVVEMTETDINDWTAWRKKFFSKLPLGYRNGEFIFPLSTVESYLETMADANNNPVFRQATGLEVNDGDATNPNGVFFGRAISLVEPDILPDFDTANEGDVIGIFWQPEEYGINTNMNFGMRRYFDEDTNEWINKMLVVLDGKVLNPKGIYLIKKAVATA